MSVWNRHLSDGVLARYVDLGERREELTPGERKHLDGCAACQRLLAGHRRSRAVLLAKDPVAALPTAPGSLASQHTVGAAGAVFATAAAMVVIAIAVAFRASAPGPALSTSQVAQHTPTVAPSSSLAHGSHASTSSPIPYTVLARASTGDAVWSPDGRWFLLWSGAKPGVVELHGAEGQLARTYAGDTALWMDGSRFLVPSGSSSVLYDVDSGSESRVGLQFGKTMRGSGHGAIAVSVSGGEAGSFVIWTPTGQQGPYAGVPIAWSPDGKRLAVGHPLPASKGQISGWVEIRNWPDSATSSAFRSVNVAVGDAIFDPSGRYLLFRGDGSLLDLQTGSVTAVIAGSAVWNKNGHILVPKYKGGIVELDVSGKQVARFESTADTMVSSADGTVALGYATGVLALPSPSISVIRMTALVDGMLPGVPWPESIHLSPDGRTALAGCALGSGGALLLIKL